MKTLDEIKTILSSNEKDLAREFKVKGLGIFGSFARGEQENASDIDILVEFQEPVGLFKFLDLEEHLSSLLETPIDLVTKKALKPHIGARILDEVVYI